MSSDWPAQTINSVDVFASFLASFGPRKGMIYRGQADASWPLRPSLDRLVPATSQYQARLQEEDDLIHEFSRITPRYLGIWERELVETYSKNNKVASMTVMQHYGAPTRLLDWTKSAAAAAYFACVDQYDDCGTVWWVVSESLEQVLNQKWEMFGFRRSPAGIDYNDRIFHADVGPFVGLVYLRIPFPRVRAQRGCFTIGSRLGILHDEVIPALIPREAYGRLNIPGHLKGDVIAFLERIGVDAVSLQHTGADHRGLRMSWERSRQLGT